MRNLIKTYEYGTTPNRYDVLKAIALLTMVIDHIGVYFFPENDWFRVIGRIALPIFLFLVGYADKFRHDTWLLIGAVAVMFGAIFTSHPLLPLNILFSILIARWVLDWLTKTQTMQNEVLMVWIALVIFYIPTAFVVEYGSVAVMVALLGWFTRREKNSTAIRVFWVLTCLMWVLTQSVSIGLNPEQIVVFGVESGVLFYWLRKTTLATTNKTEKTSPSLGNKLVILTARNTLLLYVVHVVLFQIVARMMFPDRFKHFFTLLKT